MSDVLRGCLGFKGEKGETGAVGTPKVYKGGFEELQFDAGVDRDFYYIILNSKDSLNGHWVYYDEEKDVWLAGGLYQAQGIANGSVTFEMLCEELKEILRPLMGGKEDG